MFIIFAVVMWLIFAPSGKEEEQGQSGFNTDVPAPADNALVGDKQAAYEQDLFNRKQEQRKEQMQDLASMFGSEESGEQSDDLYSEPEEEAKSNYYGGGGSSRPKETIYASANAYRDMNRTLGNFYEIPKEDPEKEEMRKELEELREMAYNRQTEKETADEQLALLEKSYQLAAKYMPQNQGNRSPDSDRCNRNRKQTDRNVQERQGADEYRRGSPGTGRVGAGTADERFGIHCRIFPRENIGFHTAVGTMGQTRKNTIRACIHANQTITDGRRYACGCWRRCVPEKRSSRKIRSLPAWGKLRAKGSASLSLAGNTGNDYSGGTDGYRRRRAGRNFHSGFDGDRRNKGDSRQSGR